MCSLAVPRPRDVRRGHEFPRSVKKRLCDAVELGDGAIVRQHQFPQLRLDVRGPPLWRASAFLGSGFGGSFKQRGGIGTASAGSLPNGIASLQGPSVRQGALPSGSCGR